MKRAKILTAVGIICAIGVQVGCAPNNARAIREDRSFTLGLPGVAYRPNGSVALGTTIGSSKDKQKLNTAEDGIEAVTNKASDENKVAFEREVEGRSFTVSPFFHYYPWDDSAFFIGLGGSYTSTKYTYAEETEGSTALAPTFTEVAYNSNTSYVGAPIGWAWIWENGITVSLDFGPRVLVSQSGSYKNDGLAGEVNEEKRDRTTEVIESVESPVTFGGSGIIGYSF